MLRALALAQVRELVRATVRATVRGTVQVRELVRELVRVRVLEPGRERLPQRGQAQARAQGQA